MDNSSNSVVAFHTETSMELVGGTLVAGRFRLQRELGHGGMGSVWQAVDTSLDTPCAIKFIIGQAAQDQAMRQRFEREAKSAAQLRSPNVVQILDHGVDDGVPYIAMELLEGEDLEHRLQRVGRLSPQETVFVMSQVGKALTRANAAGLVHRDLKPANIFLCRDEDRDIPKVLDFGVAKSTMPELADSSTKTGALMGTPYYMSPEQTRGIRTLDHRSDLWALAVITFQCVCGRLPFQSDSLGDLIFKIGTDPLPVPSHVASDVPPHFDQWWLRAAQRDPANRFQTAKEFCEALALALGVSSAGALTGGSGSHAYSGSGVSAGASPSGGWGASQGGAAASGGWGGSQSGGPLSPMGGSVSPTGGSVSPAHTGGGVIGGLPVGPTGPLTGSSGMTSGAVDKPGSRKGGAGMIVGIVGAVAVVGAIAYTVAIRGSHGASAQPVTPSPDVSSAEPAPKPTTAPVVVPSATAPVTAPVPSTSAEAPTATPTKPGPTHGPLTKVAPKPTATAAATATVPHTPTKTVPNDGI